MPRLLKRSRFLLLLCFTPVQSQTLTPTASPNTTAPTTIDHPEFEANPVYCVMTCTKMNLNHPTNGEDSRQWETAADGRKEEGRWFKLCPEIAVVNLCDGDNAWPEPLLRKYYQEQECCKNGTTKGKGNEQRICGRSGEKEKGEPLSA